MLGGDSRRKKDRKRGREPIPWAHELAKGRAVSQKKTDPKVGRKKKAKKKKPAGE